MKAFRELPDDTTLLTLLSDGDRRVFQDIYRKYWQEFFLQAHKVVRSQDVAKDIVQDIFLLLWNRRYELTHVRSLRNYLKASVRNACIRYIERHIDRFDDIELVFDRVIADSDILSAIHCKEIQDNIARSIATMPPKMRRVYEMSREEGKSHTEISQALGISKETVKKHIQHALAILKSNLREIDVASKAIIFCYLLSI